MPPAIDQDLLKLVEQHCTADQIQALLRTAKDRLPKPEKKKGKGKARAATESLKVRITAPDKATLIETNLVDAVQNGSVSVQDVHNLLRRAEENGDQHVFYFVPKTKGESIQRLMAIDRIGEELLGEQWTERKFSPKLRVSTEFDVADLRPEAADWILKLYGRERVARYGAIKIIGGRKYIPVDEEELRVVLLARWRHPNLLELRVDRNESRRRVERWLGNLWDKMKKAGAAQDLFVAWDLNNTRRALIDQEEANKPVYSTRDTRLAAPKNAARASFEGQVDSYDLFSHLEYQDAVKGLLKAGNECTDMSVKWRVVKNSLVPSREIQTLVGGRERNELVILGKCEPSDVDYITRRLRQFSR